MIIESPTTELKLPVMEHFYTIQGEGAFSGQAAYFIRVGGCDVGCHWCDVKESWDALAHPQKTVGELVESALNFPARMVVITGGEPLMYNMDGLTLALREAGFRTHLETSGAYPLSGHWDWVCFSPKKFKNPLSSIYTAADELKAIIFNISDFDFAEKHASLVEKSSKKYLQPEWSKAEAMMPLIVEYVKKNPTWAISLQTHKYLNIP